MSDVEINVIVTEGGTVDADLSSVTTIETTVEQGAEVAAELIAGGMGETGPTGPQGASGVSGVSGVVGATGATGACGVSGVSGVVGACGVSGVSGVASTVAGPSGACGVSGVSGVKGDTGACGVSGVSGAASTVAGPAGACGVSGVSGVTGVKGDTGACGVSGVAGACGVSGVAGACGVSGVAGTNGACGVSGVAGACGVSGVKGACGVSGVAGTNGACGVSGVSGVAGTNGACGVSGTAGTNGACGVSGVSGVAGACGVSGVSGVAGACGVSGVSGVAGTPGGAASWLGPWVTATSYAVNDIVSNVGSSWICTSAHTSGATTEPGVGGSYATKWLLVAQKGACGVSGVAGACGVSGVSGSNGACGVSGVAGAGGACGVSGVAGAGGACGVSGVAGACGVSGIAGSGGACGVSGVSGVSGTASSVAGPAGACGVSGVSGVSGVKGDTGACGVSGVSGVAGPTGPSGDILNVSTVNTGGVSLTTTAEIEVVKATITAKAATQYLIIANANFVKDTGTTSRAVTTNLRRGTDNTGTLLTAAHSSSGIIASMKFGTGTVSYIDTPGAGSITYRLSSANDVTATLTTAECEIVVIELSAPTGPTGPAASTDIFQNTTFDFFASGCVWTADAAGSTRAASMSAGVVYINGVRLTVPDISARTFTASKDVYVDFTDNGDGTAVPTYIDGTTNAASPALTTGGVRNAIVVVGATSIAAATSINQGQETRVLPIASSIPYAVTDSLGNLICPRNPNSTLLGYRMITANVTLTGPTATSAVAGLTCPVIVPAGRKVKVTAYTNALANSGGAASNLAICLTSASDANRLQQWNGAGSTSGFGAHLELTTTPAATSVTYVAGVSAASGNVTVSGNAVIPAFIKVELV